MACGKTIFYIFTILASLHVIWGQEGSGNGPPHPGPHHPGPQNYENEGGQNERASMSFPSFPGFGGFGSFPFASMFGSGGSGASDANSPLGSSGMSGSQVPNPFSGFSSLFGNREQEIPAPRQPQDSAVSEHDDSDHPDHQNRLFFSLLSSRITSCNYTAQPGNRCLSCTLALNCRPNNVGVLRRCFFLHPYCNNGRCSKIPGTACTSTTTTVAATTVAATTAAATTAAATTVTGG